MEKNYFGQELNYSFANEDIFVERKLVEHFSPENILSVCGSGLRAHGLIQPCIERLDLIDMAQIQLNFARFREYLISSLSFEEYLQFWQGLLDEARLLEIEKNYSLLMTGESSEISLGDPATLLLSGKWEKTFLKMGKVVELFIGKKNIQHLTAGDLERQKQVFFSLTFRWRWQILVFLMGNKKFFDAFLYRGSFVKKTIPKSYYQFYSDNFDKLFSRDLIGSNYFLQLFLWGKVEVREEISPDFSIKDFEIIKDNLKNGVKINYINQSIVEYLESCDQIYDYISFSDVPSYFDDLLSLQFLQRIKSSLRKNAVVVIRYYLHICLPDLSGYEDITHQTANITATDKVGVYQFQVLRKI